MQAFDALARIAAVLFVLGLGLFAVRDRWSARVLRYVALGGWLIWLPIYLIGPSWSIDPGHSDVRPLRSLLHSHYLAHAHRIDKPMLSTSVIAEIGWELAVTGAALVLLAAWFVRGPARQALLIGAVRVLVFVVWFWPVQASGTTATFSARPFRPLTPPPG